MIRHTLLGVRLLVLFACVARGAFAAPIEVSVTTAKASYVPGEALQFDVTARNITDQDVVLQFGTTLQSQ